MKYANWNVPERGAEIPRALLAAGCTPLLAAILHLRGLSDPAAARSFLRGGAETLTNPLELTGMVDAVQRLTRAVATGEHVAVYGDYDVDGITAACLLTDYLRFRGLTCELKIPDRIRDGYGLNTAAIDALTEKGVTLIVTVDCGVTNLEETAYAAQRGVDMIVTDHHECREALPEAEAVVDPKQPDSSGVGTALAGVGVAFKLVCAMDGDADKMLARYGDLVAVGTVADVMPLLGENRFITRCGLQKIAAGDCRPGFLALAEKGVSLIVTVDCGVTNLEETAYAAQRGVDMIVTDHHECREALPEAEAVVDPKQPDSSGVGTALAGVGVAFKLVCAMDGDADKMLARYGDLVAVGTVADVMPLLGENRFITRCGLQKIAAGDCRPGFLALAEEAGVRDKPFTASTVGFSLAPRINAAGRLGEPGLAVRLLEETDLRRARVLAAELCAKNRERQALETEIWREAVERLHGEQPDAPIVLASEGWHPGVIGIVASRLTDAYSVPAVMICLDGESGKGSCRSTGSFNLFEALSACSDCLDGFGGHAMAAGVTVRRGYVDELRSRLREYYLSHPDRTLPALEADLLIDSPELLTMACVESLDELEPCGNGNPRPLLYMDNVSLDSVQPIGGGKHLRLKLAKFGQTYDGVFFSQTAPALGARAGQRCDIVFAPQINEFHGRRSVQLVITDLRRSKEG